MLIDSHCIRRSFAVAAVVATLPVPFAWAEGTEPLPVDVELAAIKIHYGKPSSRKMDITFQVKSKDDSWVVWAERETERKRRAKEDDHPEVFRSYFMRNDEDQSLRLNFSKADVPQGERIELQETFLLKRSKQGRVLPEQTIELGKAGSFEAGGIRFEYEGRPGRIVYVKDGEKCVDSDCHIEFRSNRRAGERECHYSGELTLTYPENAELASLEIRDERGNLLDTTPSSRERGKTQFSLPSYGNVNKVRLRIVLSDAEESFELPLKKTIALGDVAAGQKSPIRGRTLQVYGALSWMFARMDLNRTRNEGKGAAVCAAEVEVDELNLGNRKMTLVENEGSLSLRLKPAEGYLFLNKPAKILAHDSEGNELFCDVYSWDDENRSLIVNLSFNRLPKGDWIELDTGLPLAHAKRLRALPARTLPFWGKGSGSFEAGEGKIQYNGDIPETIKKFCDSERGNHMLLLSLPDDETVANVAFFDAEGNEVNCSFTYEYEGKVGRQLTNRLYFFSPSLENEVSVVVTLREENEPCVVPLKLRVGLDGMTKTRDKQDESGESDRS